MNPRHWARPVLGMVLGMVAITLVTALLTAAVYSVSAANSVNGLVHHQLADANQQLDALRANADASKVRSAQAATERADLMRQNDTLQHEVNGLVRYLRNHGIQIPVSVVHPQPGRQPSNRPKGSTGHRPHHRGGPGSPGPPPVTPSTGTITELCALVAMPIPMLCP